MNAETRHFIEQNREADVRQLALRRCADECVNMTLALQQIAGWQTARRKLPSWAARDGLLYPPHLNMEQCSSEATARYKADICRRLLSEKSLDCRTSLIDLTGGFGVDFAFMSEAFNEGTYVERDSSLFAIASANMGILCPQAHCINDDAIDTLHRLDQATMLFLDPARRDDHGARTYGISDCTPDVVALRDLLLEKADRVIIKLSPMPMTIGLPFRAAISSSG